MFHRLNRRLDVWRAQAHDDGAGGQTVVRAVVGTVRARVPQPGTTPSERVSGQQAGADRDHALDLAPKSDVARGDHLRTAGAQADSRPYYRVIAVVAPSSGSHLRAQCELVEAEGDQ